MGRNWFFGLATAIAGAALLSLAGNAAAAEKVKMNQGWTTAGKYAPMYIADAKGWYKAKGLDVTIRRGYGSVAQAKAVAEGIADYTMDVDTGVLIKARARGAKIKEVGIVYGKFPITFNSVIDPKTGRPRVPTARDLEGKTVGTSTGSSTYGLWPGYAKEAGIDISKVKIINMKGSEIYTPALLAGSLDATFGFHASDNAVAVVAARRAGKKLHIVPWSKASPRFSSSYANGMVVRDADIENRTKVVAAMVQTTFRAFAYCMSHFDECTDVLMKRFPMMQREIAETQLRQILDVVLTPEAIKNGLGYMRKDKMVFTTKLINDLYAHKTRVRPEDVYTNRFIVKIPLPADYAKWSKL